MDTTQDRTLVGRRERPSKAALSRESIVTVTLKQEQASDDEALRTTIQSLVAANSPDLPYIVAGGGDLISGEGPQRGAWSFEVILNGLPATPRPGTTNPRED